MNTNTLSSSQRIDAFFFEVLEMSLAELDTKKSIKVTWLSEGLTKEVSDYEVFYGVLAVTKQYLGPF